MSRPAAPLRGSSVAWCVATLVTAWAWAAAVMAYSYGYHQAQPARGWAQIGGHTFFLHPPAQTLAQRDPASAQIVTIALALALGIGTLDLIVRTALRMSTRGGAATTAGTMLILFSLFGLLWGLLALGTAGLFVILSARPMRSTTGPTGPTHPGGPAATWYADPTGRFDLRYWDGVAWSPYVSRDGRPGVDPVRSGIGVRTRNRGGTTR